MIRWGPCVFYIPMTWHAPLIIPDQIIIKRHTIRILSTWSVHVIWRDGLVISAYLMLHVKSCESGVVQPVPKVKHCSKWAHYINKGVGSTDWVKEPTGLGFWLPNRILQVRNRMLGRINIRLPERAETCHKIKLIFTFGLLLLSIIIWIIISHVDYTIRH